MDQIRLRMTNMNLDDDPLLGDSQRDRLLKANERIERSTNVLHHSLQVVNETIDVGASTLRDLEHQGQVMKKSRKKLEEVDENISQSDSILKGMTRRMKTGKCLIAFIVCVLLGLIGLVIYFLVRKVDSDHP